MGIGRRGFIGAGVASLFAGSLPAKPPGLPATNGRQVRLITPNVQSFEMTIPYPMGV